MTTALNIISEDMAADPTPARRAIHNASRATGVNFDYLVTTAQRESNLNPMARARGSSASGLFQFIDSTWLSTLKEHGAEYGYAREAGAIRATGRGFAIDDPGMRQHIMDLRFDPNANAMMGAAYTQQNISSLESALGRSPNPGEIYIAHFLGAQGAAKFILGTFRNPNAAAADVFPRAADANRTIFFDHDGKRSMNEVYASLVSHHQNAALDTQRIAHASPPVTTVADAHPLYRNMFTPQRQGGVSPVVAALWTPQTAGANVTQAAARKPFYPMTRTAESASLPPKNGPTLL